jgi:DNA-binding NarL/FixJ family response regulator
MMEDHEELVIQGEALGMTGYVLKPFDVFSLSKSLDQMHKKEE